MPEFIYVIRKSGLCDSRRPVDFFLSYEGACNALDEKARKVNGKYSGERYSEYVVNQRKGYLQIGIVGGNESYQVLEVTRERINP